MRSSLMWCNRLYGGVLALLASAAVTAAEIQLHAPDSVQVGAAVPVEIRISAVTDLYAWQLDLQPSVHLSVSTVAAGGVIS